MQISAGLFDDVKDKLPDPRREAEEKAKEEARRKLHQQVPDLARIRKEEPGLTTSFDDAVTGVPFLDDFEPAYTAPLNELPPTGDGDFFIALPGVYEFEAQSYCLHAGTHGPGQGRGHLLAPIEGPQAGIITDILKRSAQYPEISQTHVQSLIWGIQAKAKISNMGEELQDAAGKLLTPGQIRRLNGGALSAVPEALFDQAFVDIPAPIRRIKKAEARIRSRLTADSYTFDELERVAVLSGPPPETSGGPTVPRGRWSIDPQGYFIRFFPHGYSRTTVQIARPRDFLIQTDDLGRIVSIADRFENRISFTYDDSVSPMTCARDDRTKGYAFEAIRFTQPDADSPDGVRDRELRDVGWTAIGLPTERGRPLRPTERFAEARGRYEWAKGHLQEIRQLAGQFEQTAGRDALIGNLVDLGHLAKAVSAAIDEGEGDASEILPYPAMVKQAWQSQLVALLAPASATDVTWRVRPDRNIMLASRNLDGSLLASGETEWPRRKRRSPRLRLYRKGAVPANRDGQRLGQSYRPSPSTTGSDRLQWIEPEQQNPDGSPNGGSGCQAFNNAKTAIDIINKTKTAVDLVFDPVGGAMGLLGLDIPGGLFGSIIDFNFDAWGKAADALGGDPPRDDYDVVAEPEPVDYPQLPADVTAGIPAKRAAALQQLMSAFADQMSTFNAAQITLDRLGGAVQAGDDEWITTQSQLLLDYKHQAGVDMIAIADAMDAYIAALESEGIDEIIVSADHVRAYQERLRTEGFNATERKAADIVGITEPQLRGIIEDRTGVDPQQEAGDALVAWRRAAIAIRDLGMNWRTLPQRP